MAEYINREEIMKFPIHIRHYVYGIESVMEYIKHIPTVDAVEVVRCKDCIYKKNAKANHKGFLICPASGMEITNNDFCSYGEKSRF